MAWSIVTLSFRCSTKVSRRVCEGMEGDRVPAVKRMSMVTEGDGELAAIGAAASAPAWA